MVNKLTITVLGLGFALGALATWQSGTQAGEQGAVEVQVGQSVENGNPPAETPAIQEALILQGWDLLRSKKELIQVGDGMVLSGESLAMYLVENQIPVVWGSEAICGGSSCSRMYCGPDGNCSYEDGQPGIDPIYLNPAIRTQGVGMMERLAGELAHEAYHRMLPFGSEKISQLEEYWAFYVGTQVSQAGWPKFTGVDPQNPTQLQNWFYAHGLNGYLKLAPYPGAAAPGFQGGQGGRALASATNE